MKEKTLADWHTSPANDLYEYLEIGDPVDLAMVEHFRNVLPPITNVSNMVQVGEPVGHYLDSANVIRAAYTTFTRMGGQWYFCGDCFLGEREPCYR